MGGDPAHAEGGVEAVGEDGGEEGAVLEGVSGEVGVRGGDFFGGVALFYSEYSVERIVWISLCLLAIFISTEEMLGYRQGFFCSPPFGLLLVKSKP